VIGPEFRQGGMFDLFPRMLARQALATRLSWPGRASFISRSDTVKLLLTLPDLPAAANQSYVVGNGERPTFDELLGSIATLHGYRRRRLVLPGVFWGAIGWLAWQCASLPPWWYRLHNTAWRLSNMIGDGLCADAAKLDGLVGMRYQTVAEALAEAYADRNTEQKSWQPNSK